MKIHILGVCGTFMGSLAILASKLGLEVSGQDINVYPPMSSQLAEHNIQVTDGYATEDLPADADLIIIGNVMRRGLPIVEHILDHKLAFMSGPEFLAQYILKDQHVFVVTGTHGKTTTASILAWILQYAGLQPGYLIGGVPNNFGVSAELGAGKYFVVEGDEYDCAFFDKRSKFVHYRPQTVILNNIEFDHADIFPDLKAILTQFHYLMRIVPSNGLIVYRQDDKNIKSVLDNGCWTPKVSFGLKNAEYDPTILGSEALPMSLLGEHNKLNALAALAAAKNAGVTPELAVLALHEFTGVKRRLEVKGKAEKQDITVYSDFAHHPTAIETTIAGLRSLVGKKHRIIAVVDICSNTMKAGVHKNTLSNCMDDADLLYFYHSTELSWDLKTTWIDAYKPGGVFDDQAKLLAAMLPELRNGDYVLLMSNGAFESFAQQLLGELSAERVV
jgi:UDP-N-acetylmuramate: L-alanyl-gamma-D-glutamyl-meso-diaminopimelate ligase